MFFWQYLAARAVIKVCNYPVSNPATIIGNIITLAFLGAFAGWITPSNWFFWPIFGSMLYIVADTIAAIAALDTSKSGNTRARNTDYNERMKALYNAKHSIVSAPKPTSKPTPKDRDFLALMLDDMRTKSASKPAPKPASKSAPSTYY